MKILILLATLAALNACASDKTSDFFKRKSQLQKALELKPNDQADALGREELKGLVLEIVGPTRIDERKYKPVYSVATLQEEPGFDMLDGIVYHNDSFNSTLFVTTKKLLGMDQLKTFNANLLDEDKVRKAFFPDSAVIWKESYKEELGRKNGSFLLSVGQDISSQGPNFLLTYFFSGEGDKLAMQLVDLDFPPVPKCEQLFNTDNDADTVKLVAQCYVNNLPAQFSEELDFKSKQSQTELHAVWLN